MCYFNPRAPYGARPPVVISVDRAKNFNPRAPYGARRGNGTGSVYQLPFQSTRPIRGATPHSCRHTFATLIFQSTRPIRGATRGHKRPAQSQRISIHAPHTGRDAVTTGLSWASRISIHAPHTGRDSNIQIRAGDGHVFQSTRPIRGATL